MPIADGEARSRWNALMIRIGNAHVERAVDDRLSKGMSVS